MMQRSSVTRRGVLKYAALGTTAAIAAPYISPTYAAGKLTLGVWDHWVPGANNTLTKLCNEWGEKNKVEVTIDYITSQGDKDLLTASAEAQARAGHDIMSHRTWICQARCDMISWPARLADPSAPQRSRAGRRRYQNARRQGRPDQSGIRIS